MPTEADRNELAKVIEDKDTSKIREFLQRDDAKELLLMRDAEYGHLPIHGAYRYELDETCFQLIFDTAVEHGIIRQMLEEKEQNGSTCLHLASTSGLDSLCLLLEYLSKYVDIKKMLEEKENRGWSCLHYACSPYVSTDSLRLLISFYPSKEIFENALAAKNNENKTPVDHVKNDEVKKLLQDPDCWRRSRAWLFSKYQDSFLYSLHPNSLDKTCYALKELTDNGLQQAKRHAMILLIALMSSPSKFRKAVDKTDSMAPMASYFGVVKKGDKKSDYNHWRKNIGFFRECYGQWPPSDRQMVTRYVPVGCTCVIQ